MKYKILLPLLAVYGLLTGCSSRTPTTPTVTAGPRAEILKENDLFLSQKTFDPWKLTSTDPANPVPAYLPGQNGIVIDPSGVTTYDAGSYDNNGVVVSSRANTNTPSPGSFSQVLDLSDGSLTTFNGSDSRKVRDLRDWQTFWSKSDIAITGDPEAQQVTHAELFYLCGSAVPGKDYSVPPMGWSSNVYNGHIFWDAEMWMMPALLPQHPDLAKTIIDYRFNRLKAAESLAKEHGFAGAEFPWESATTGLEQAPVEFSHERHITADVAYAAWQYYLWSGDKTYLANEGWPILLQTANYWVSRVKTASDGKLHIADVVGPDETAGLVTDNAWTNAVAQYNLLAAVAASNVLGKAANPNWAKVAAKLYIPFDSADNIYLEYPKLDRLRSQAKQADTQMLIYPLNLPMATAVKSNTLDYYIKHTIQYGPAMTSSINAVIAAKLGRAQQSLDLFHDSYRPFMRGPWDAFSEKRTKSDVYFTTGMGGNLQVTLYGFAGLNIASLGRVGDGTLVARSGDAALYVNPHLPPGWSELRIEGVHFRGSSYTLDLKANKPALITKD